MTPWPVRGSCQLNVQHTRGWGAVGVAKRPSGRRAGVHPYPRGYDRRECMATRRSLNHRSHMPLNGMPFSSSQLAGHSFGSGWAAPLAWLVAASRCSF